MTTTSDQSALLAAILADPADDTARLVYADWLEENDQPERAEFIRVQIRMASLRAQCRCGACVKPGEQHHNSSCAVNKERDELPDGRSKPAMLRARERELLANHLRNWASEPFACDNLIELFNINEGRINLPRARFTRGFVSQVTCTSTDWLRHEGAIYWHPGQTVECPECKGTLIRSVKCGLGHTHRVDCYCDSGRIPRPLPPTAQPIERVVLTTPVVEGSFGPGRFDGKEWTFDRWSGIVFEVRPAT